MLLVIEIILTSWACVRLSEAKKTWFLGLLPILIGIGIGFVVGLVVAATGGSIASIFVPLLFLDFVIIAILIWIVAANKPIVS